MPKFVLSFALITTLVISLTACQTTKSTPEPEAEAKAPAEKRQPNIIFIITDDQRFDDLGFIGGAALTPHLNALASGGMYLSQKYVTSSVCTPSRYTCLTGQYASRSQSPAFLNEITPEGITYVMWNQGFEPDQPTVPSVLQDAGYATGFVGKWHVGLDGKRPPFPEGADPTDPSDPGLIQKLKGDQKVFSDYLKTLGFDFAKNIYIGNPDDDQNLKKAGLNVHNQEWLTQAGLEFIEENKDQPFYLYFSTTLTHVPEPTDSLLLDPRMSPVGMLEEPITGVQPSREDVIKRVKEAGIPKDLWGTTWLDDGVGAIVAKVEELGLAEDTLIIYFPDHGMANWSKGTLYHGGMVAPTVAYWPGTIPAGTKLEHMTANTDFASTFFDLAGATPSEDMELDGESLVDLLKGGDTPVRDSVYGEVGLTRSVTTADGWKYLAFRVPPSKQRTLEERMPEHLAAIEKLKETHPWTKNNPSWTFIDPEARYAHLGQAPGGSFFERIILHQKDLPFMPNYHDADQLYNLNEDPNETTNLADDPAYAAKLAEMKVIMQNYLNDVPGTFAELKPEE
ncbi:MAG: sulfatase-like hydrolase/transferase [Planctomycetota bacterium]